MSKNQPFISIIIPVYNSANMLHYCLLPFTRQTYPATRFELLIVNDGSTDEFRPTLQTLELPVNTRIIEHDRNRGLAAARNSGIREARGDILVFLDSDLEVTTDYLEKIAARLHPKNVIGVLGSTAPAPETPVDKYQRYLYEAPRGAQKIPTGQPLPFRAFLFNNTSLKRSALNKVPLFDEKIKVYGGEDTEFSYRLSKHFRGRFFYASEIRAIHHHYRPIETALENIENFGRTVVPYLLRKHPGLISLYGANFLDCRAIFPEQFYNPFKLAAGFILKNRVFRILMLAVYRIIPFPLSNGIVKLLMASALLHGLSRAIHDDRNR